MTIVGVLADTHIREGSNRTIPDQVWKAFEDVQLILHGGDVTCQRVLDELSTLAPVRAVRGNNDDGTFGSTLPVSRRVEVEEVVIGMAHGDLPALGRERPKPLLDASGNRQTGANAVSHFEFDDDVSCIVFGHSHRPLLQEREIDGRKVLLLNPGSPTDRRYSPHFGCAVLIIDGETLRPKLVTW